MRENFDKAVNFLFDLEGYESNDTYDPGGHTKYGISKTYNPDIDINALTKEQAKEIYLNRYWKVLGCDSLPFPWDVLMFVQGVNIGFTVKQYYNADETTIFDFFMANMKHYTTRPRDLRGRYLTGWCNRLLRLYDFIKG